MSEMVERVARALQAATRSRIRTWETLSDNEKQERRRYARAAITEILNPTQAMTTAGVDVVYSDHLMVESSDVLAVKMWRAMIDEALK